MKKFVLMLLTLFSVCAWALPANNFVGDVNIKSGAKLLLENDVYLYYGTTGQFNQRYNSSTAKFEVKDAAGNIMWYGTDSGTAGILCATGGLAVGPANEGVLTYFSDHIRLAMERTSGSVTIDLDPDPNDGTSISWFRFFRDVNTSGERKILVYKGDGTSTVMATVDASVGSLTLVGDAAVNGGDITTSATTFNALNTTVTTGNLFGAATTVNIGKDNTTTINLKAGTIATGQTALTLANTTATTVNAFGAATTLNMGAAAGTATLAGNVAVGKVLKTTAVVTFSANDTTPDVSGGNIFKVPATWTAGNNITAFDSGATGQTITIIGGDSDCVVTDGSTLKLAGNWTAAADDTLVLTYDGTNWFRVGGSDN